MLPRSFRLPARASSDESVLLLYKMPTPDEHGKGGKSACSPCSSKRDRPKWRYFNISYQSVSDVNWHIHLLGIAVLQALLRNQAFMLAHCSFISPPTFHDTGDAF